MLQTTQSCSGKLRNAEICFHKSNTVVVSEVSNWHDFRSWSFPFRERFFDSNGTATRQSFLLRHTTNEHDVRPENRLTTHVILVRSHFTVLLSHYFTHSSCQNWNTYAVGRAFLPPIKRGQCIVVISGLVKPLYFSPSSSNPWTPTFCFSAGNRWQIIPRWRNPLCNHAHSLFFGYWIICHANLFSARSKYFLPNGTQRECERGANTSWETGGLDVITSTTTLLARKDHTANCFLPRFLDYTLITNLMHYYLFVKYYSPLHVSSIKCSSSGGQSCMQAAYGTVTL